MYYFSVFFLNYVEESLKSGVSVGVAMRKIDLVVSVLEIIAEGESVVVPAASRNVVLRVLDVDAPSVPASFVLLVLLFGKYADSHTIIVSRVALGEVKDVKSFKSDLFIVSNAKKKPLSATISVDVLLNE